VKTHYTEWEGHLPKASTALIRMASRSKKKLCGRPPKYAPAPCKLTDLLTLKAVSESRVTWATSVPISVFRDLSVLDLGPMYATDRRQTVCSHTELFSWVIISVLDLLIQFTLCT